MVKLAFKPTDQVEITSKVSKKVELNLNPFNDNDHVLDVKDDATTEGPQTTKELIGLENCHYTLKKWYKPDAKLLLIIGPTGCGKTKLIELFCKENDILLHSVKVSESKTKKDILKDIETFKGYNINFFTNKFSKKLVLIDEYQNGQNELCISDINEITLPVVVISSDSKGSKLSELKKNNEVYYINEIPFYQLKSWINTFAKDLPEEKINKLIKNSKSDKRLILNTVNFLKKSDNISFNPNDFYKDTDINVFEYINNLFDNVEPPEISEMFRIYETDGYLLASLIQENYLDYNNSIDNIAKSAESISLGETIFSDTYESNKSFLPEYHFISSMAIPSYYSRNDYKTNKCTIRTSTINNRFNIYLNNKKILDRINLNEERVINIEEFYYIKKFISRDIIKSKVLTENQLGFLKNVMGTWKTSKIEKLELIYKHLNDFKESQGIKEVKTKNFTIKFKEKLNKLI
jgi:hypothetical protein